MVFSELIVAFYFNFGAFGETLIKNLRIVMRLKIYLELISLWLSILGLGFLMISDSCLAEKDVIFFFMGVQTLTKLRFSRNTFTETEKEKFKVTSLSS